MTDELTKAEEVAKGALGISWWDTESAARRVAEHAAELIAEQLETQTYTYYGKDGRPVLARDLEDRLEAANARISELERALGALKYWFDTDPDVLDAMSTDELADHNRQAALIEAALIAADEQPTETDNG